jgi:hypothetical protein
MGGSKLNLQKKGGKENGLIPLSPNIIAPVNQSLQAQAAMYSGWGIDGTQKSQISRQMDVLTLDPEPLYICLYSFPFQTPEMKQLLECIMESSKAGDYSLALNAWEQLRKTVLTKGKMSTLEDNCLYFLRGLILERLGKTHLALECFYECLCIFNQLTNQDRRRRLRSYLRFFWHRNVFVQGKSGSG